MRFIKRLLYQFDNNGKKELRNKLSNRFAGLIKVTIRFLLFFYRKKLVIILSNGKAGSTSVLEAMSRAGFRVFQLHEVNEDRIEEKLASNLRSRKNSIPLHLLVSKAFVFNKRINYKKVKFILIYRNDNRQNLSALFQNYDLHHTKDLESIEYCKREVKIINEDNKDWLEKTSSWLSHRADINNIINLNYAESSEWSCQLSTKFNREILVLRKNVGANKFYSSQYDYMQKNIL